MALIAFFVVGGLLLAYEHRVHVLTGNGILIALLALCIGMHFFMHGGHGGRGGHGDHGGRDGGDGRGDGRGDEGGHEGGGEGGRP